MYADGVTSRYRRYKADTNAVASWLITTAEKCGYHLPPTGRPDVSTKSLRLKGKARKLARERGGATSERQSQPYILKTDAFVPLAQWIVNSRKPRMLVPASFAYILQEAIAERKRFQRYYEKTGDVCASATASDGHGHFISVLESVREILRPNLEPGVNFEKENGNEDLHIHFEASGFENMFARLSVEDSSNEFTCSADEDPCLAWVDCRRAEVVTDPASDLLEEFTVKALFWSDIHRIRMLVRYIWQKYEAGESDLAAAAITTNTAVDLVRSLHEDFERTWRGNVNFERRACLHCAMLQDSINATSDNEFDLDVPCLMPGWLTISIWTEQFKNDPEDFAPTIHPDLVGLFNMVAQDASKKDKVKQDVDLAFGLIPEYCILLKCCSSVQAEHGLIGGLREQMQHDRPLFWLAFAIQIFIDVRKILRTDIGRGFEDLCREASLIRHGIKGVLDFEREANSAPLTDSTDQSLKAVLELMDRYTKNDFVGALRKDILLKPSADNHIEDYYLLRRDPVWCGLLLYNFRMVAHEGSIYRANSFMSILALAHLYNALKQANLLECKWMSMEHILNTHRCEELFVGTVPPTLGESSKNMLLAMGMSPTLFARARRHGSSLRRCAPRQLKRVAPVTWLFKARYCDSDGRTSLKPSDIVDGMRTAATDQGKPLNPHLNTATVQIEQLLHCLLGFLELENLSITHDYFRLHMTCWRLLCQLHKNYGNKITGWNEIYNEKGARALPFLVQCLLQDALEAARGQAVSGDLAGDAMRMVLTDSAELVMQVIKDTEGAMIRQPEESL